MNLFYTDAVCKIDQYTILAYNNSCSSAAGTLIAGFLLRAMSDVYALGVIMRRPRQISLCASISESPLNSPDIGSVGFLVQ